MSNTLERQSSARVRSHSGRSVKSASYVDICLIFRTWWFDKENKVSVCVVDWSWALLISHGGQFCCVLIQLSACDTISNNSNNKKEGSCGSSKHERERKRVVMQTMQVVGIMGYIGVFPPLLFTILTQTAHICSDINIQDLRLRDDFIGCVEQEGNQNQSTIVSNCSPL